LITTVVVAKGVYEIFLFELDRDEDVCSRGDGKDEMGHSHRRRGPECEEPAEIEWMANVPVKHRRPEFQLRVWSSDQKQEHLSQSKQIEVIDQERAAQHQQPAYGVKP